MSTQTVTSKNTSVNSTKIPAIFKKINYRALTENADKTHRRLLIVDYGCGKYYQMTQNLLWSIINHQVPSLSYMYLPYDPYWCPWDKQQRDDLTMEEWIIRWRNNNPSDVVICICANVLNVIDSLEEICHIKDRLWNISPYSFFSVYEGDRSGIAETTKKDCFQRNSPLKAYEDIHFFSTKNGVLLNPEAEIFVYSKTPHYPF